jgi:hypothetical protein
VHRLTGAHFRSQRERARGVPREKCGISGRAAYSSCSRRHVSRHRRVTIPAEEYRPPSPAWSSYFFEKAAYMTLDDAIAAVEATLDSAHLRVDRKRAREDVASYLVLVLDISGGWRDEGSVANGPRLVDKHSGKVTRLTVPDALARAERMALVRS